MDGMCRIELREFGVGSRLDSDVQRAMEGRDWKRAARLLRTVVDSIATSSGQGTLPAPQFPGSHSNDSAEHDPDTPSLPLHVRSILQARFRLLRCSFRTQAWDDCIEECREIYELLLRFDLRSDPLLGWIGLVHAVAQFEKGWGDRFRGSLAAVLRHSRRCPETRMSQYARELASCYRSERWGCDGGLAPEGRVLGRHGPNRRPGSGHAEHGPGRKTPPIGREGRPGPLAPPSPRGWPGLLHRSSLGGALVERQWAPLGLDEHADIDCAREWIRLLGRTGPDSPLPLPGMLVRASRAIVRNVGELSDEDRRESRAGLEILAMKAQSAWARASCLVALAEVSIWMSGSDPDLVSRRLLRVRSDFGLAAGIYQRLRIEQWARASEERAATLGCLVASGTPAALGPPAGSRWNRDEVRAPDRQRRARSQRNGGAPCPPTPSEIRRRAAAHGFLTTDQRTLQELVRLALLAPSPLPVLVHGESGTGKELLARAIHEWSGVSGELIAIHCGAIPRDLLESELFGHARGAFTGASGEKPGLIETANQGTLFLDEIGEMSAEAQMKMLRVLESGEVRRVGDVRTRRVRVRIVAATHRDLRAQVRSKLFREDLYHRIGSIRVAIPPLRARRADLPLLVQQVLASVDRNLRIGEEALSAVMCHPWRGNVRELRSSLLQAAHLARALGHTVIGAELLGLAQPGKRHRGAASGLWFGNLRPTGGTAGPSRGAERDAETPAVMAELEPIGDDEGDLQLAAAIATGTERPGLARTAGEFRDAEVDANEASSEESPTRIETPGPRLRFAGGLGDIPPVEDVGLEGVLESLERRLILRALEESGWNRTHAARSLGGLSRTTLIGKMRRLGIEDDRPAAPASAHASAHIAADASARVSGPASGPMSGPASGPMSAPVPGRLPVPVSAVEEPEPTSRQASAGRRV